MGRPDARIREAMLAHLKQNHPAMCRHWFEDIEPLELSNGTLRLLVHEPVQLKYLQRCCVQQFTEAAQVATGRLLAVRFIGDADLSEEGLGAGPNGDFREELAGPSTAEKRSATAPRQPTGARGAARRPSAIEHALDEDMLLSPDYNFSNFVIGPGNRLAHAAAMAVAQKPGKSYNPFFIHGGVGLGKTHLLQAICQAAMQNNSSTRICYISCNGFMTYFLDAVQAGQMSDFRHRFRNVDILIVDDIHDLSKRDRTQEEFFHTFNALYQAGRQIVLSSDASPSEIPSLEERLVSRFNCGLVARIEKPCYETRVAIVKSKAQMRDIQMPDDVASYIAAKIDTNIRELEGAIIKMQGISLVNVCPIDLELAKQAIGEPSSSGGGAPGPSIQTILETISKYYDLRLTDLLSKRRHKSIARPRQIGMWLARKHTRYSLEEIGSYFGGRDHTTVMHAIRAIEARREQDETLEREVTNLEDRLAPADQPGVAASE